MGRHAYEGARLMVFALAMVKMRDGEDIQQALTGAGKKIKKRMSPSSLKSRKRRMMKKRADKRVGSINNSSSSGVIKSEGGIPFVPNLKLIDKWRMLTRTNL